MVFWDPHDAEFQAQARRMAARLQERGIRVVYQGVPNSGVFRELPALGPQDQVTLLINCHGTISGIDGSTHRICADDRENVQVTMAKLREIQGLVTSQGARLGVLDLSCGSGASILELATDGRTCVIAQTIDRNIALHANWGEFGLERRGATSTAAQFAFEQRLASLENRWDRSLVFNGGTRSQCSEPFFAVRDSLWRASAALDSAALRRMPEFLRLQRAMESNLDPDTRLNTNILPEYIFPAPGPRSLSGAMEAQCRIQDELQEQLIELMQWMARIDQRLSNRSGEVRRIFGHVSQRMRRRNVLPTPAPASLSEAESQLIALSDRMSTLRRQERELVTRINRLLEDPSGVGVEVRPVAQQLLQAQDSMRQALIQANRLLALIEETTCRFREPPGVCESYPL